MLDCQGSAVTQHLKPVYDKDLVAFKYLLSPFLYTHAFQTFLKVNERNDLFYFIVFFYMQKVLLAISMFTLNVEHIWTFKTTTEFLDKKRIILMCGSVVFK